MEQPSTVQLEPEHQLTPTNQHATPSPQMQQQTQSASVSPPNQEQFMNRRMQQQQQQQFIALQPCSVNWAAQPQFGQQQPYQVAQQFPHQRAGAVVLGSVVASAPRDRRYRDKTAKTLGALQISIAITSVLLGIVSVAIGTWWSVVGMPIWGAICFFLPAGILGVVSAKPSNMQNCEINSCLVMSLLAGVIAGIIAIISTIACFNEYYYPPYPYGGYIMAGNVITDVLVAIVSLGEVIISTIQSAHCCNATCDCCKPSPTETLEYAPQVRYTAPQQNMQPLLASPMQQQQQFKIQQRQQALMMQHQQQGYRVQNVIPPQSTPRDVQFSQPSSVSDYLVNHDGGNVPALPEYSEAPPPSYNSLSAGYI